MFSLPLQHCFVLRFVSCFVLGLLFTGFCLGLSSSAYAQNHVDPGAMLQQDWLRNNQPDFYNPSLMRQGSRLKPGKLEPVIIMREDVKVKAKLLLSPPLTPETTLEPLTPITAITPSTPTLPSHNATLLDSKQLESKLNPKPFLPIPASEHFQAWTFQQPSSVKSH